MELFKLFGSIAVNNAEANTALDDTGSKGEKAESKLSKAFNAIGNGAVAVGKTMAVGLAAGASAMTALTVKAMNLSGELEQNMGGSEAVFGEYAEKMQETAQEAFSEMGLSTSDYLATANKMGALFQGAGFSVEESMNISSEAMQRAADVASIMGIDTASAMEAVAGAAKGNFTMMDNLGVAMNDTTLQAYALEKGIEKSTTEMTNQEKIGLAMELFMEKTAYAAGNYAKENETLAGSLGTAKAALTNFLDGSGDADGLVASFTNAANVIVENLTGILPRLTTGLTEIVQGIMPILPPLLEMLLPSIIEGAISLINGIVAVIPTIIPILLEALPALIDGMMQIMGAIILALPQIMEMLIASLPALIPQLVTGLVSMIVLLCDSFASIIQPIVDYAPDIIIAIVDALIQNLPALIDGSVQLVTALVVALPEILAGLWEALVSIFGDIWETIKGVFDPVVEWFSNLWTSLGSVPGLSDLKTMIEEVWGAIKAHIETVTNTIKEVVTTVWNNIKTIVSTVVNGIKTVISAVWNSIKTIVSNVMKIISSVLKGDWEGVKTAISNIIESIKTTITTVWNTIKNVISTVVSAIKGNISAVWNGIKTIISSVVDTIKTTISSVFNGIKNTISTVFNGIKTTAGSAWNDILSKIKTPIEKARDVVKSAIDKIKGFFNFKISWPNIPMPHFSISPSGWKIGDLLKGSIPSLDIDWYAKAMDNAMLLNDPTIFGMNGNGQLMGGGEAGQEVVAGSDTLMNMIGDTVDAKVSVAFDRLCRYMDEVIGVNQEMLNAIRNGHVLELDGRELGRTVKTYA